MDRILSIFVFALMFSPQVQALVDMRNGNYMDTYVDMRVPGAGYDLQVLRIYNSRTLFNGMFGFGHCSELETTLEITPENTIRLTECGAGQELIFTPKNFNTAAIQGTVNTIMAEVKKRNKTASANFLKQLEKDLKTNDTLRREFTRELQLSGKVTAGVQYTANGLSNESIVLNGDTYKRLMADGTFEIYDKTGRMIAKHDKNGNFLKMAYNKDQLTTVVDNNGRQLNFNYDPKTKKVSDIRGPNGLKIKYNIKGQSLLAVTNAWGNTYKYKYDELNNMTRIDYPDKTHKELTYNKEKDWVMSFKDRKGCTESYDYGVSKTDPDNNYWSDVKKVCGKKITNKSHYEFWNKDRPDGTKALVRVRSEVNEAITDISYDEVFGKPVSKLENGRRTLFSYFENGFLKTKTEEAKTTTYSY
ncbi:MAG: RHS repeat protein, partial [Bdellovibrionales bacterium]|nr:RHS repeat protein [Bdellovibrionales bacterium]